MKCVLFVCLDEAFDENSNQTLNNLVLSDEYNSAIVFMAGLEPTALTPIMRRLRHHLYNTEEFLRYDEEVWLEFPSFTEIIFVKHGNLSKFRQSLSPKDREAELFKRSMLSRTRAQH